MPCMYQCCITLCCFSFFCALLQTISCTIFRYMVIHQVHAMDATCAKVFDFALVFTVHYPERLTTCETFTNQRVTILMYPQCGKMLITARSGTFTHVMQLGNVGEYIAEITQALECGPLDKMVLLLANTKYHSNSLAGYRMTVYLVQLQYLSDLYRVFELRSDAVLFYFIIFSPNCYVDIYYRRVIRRTLRARLPMIGTNKVI